MSYDERGIVEIIVCVLLAQRIASALGGFQGSSDEVRLWGFLTSKCIAQSRTLWKDVTTGFDHLYISN